MEQKKEKNSREKLADLRKAMKRQNTDAYLVPRGDEYLGEYVPARAERLSWLTGFTGSAGTAVVTNDRAAVLTDGRYQIQVRQQIDNNYFETGDSGEMTPGQWLGQHLKPGATVSYDPQLHSFAEIEALEKDLAAHNIKLKPVGQNLVDAVWDDQPAAPSSKIEIYPQHLAGKSAVEKSDEVAATIKEQGAMAAVLGAPDSVAWLLNIRGRDVPHTPLALSRAIIYEDGAIDWFIDTDRVGADIPAHIGPHVKLRDPSELPQALLDMGTRSAQENKAVLGDNNRIAIWFKMMIEQGGGTYKNAADPCVALKAVKTPEEQQGIINAHIRDGVAIVRFLKWLDDEAPHGKLTEMDVEAQLLSIRKKDKAFLDTSFDTIAGWGAHGAIIHYRVDKTSNQTITPPGLMLVDSGAQYQDGTTDITRTMGIGNVSDEMKENFTRVLKGHIGLARLRFPQGITGKEIDILARKALWEADLDYAHGTGHGVGAYLGVHESGTGISSRANDAFKPGMLISNEPGYYKEGAYGIRIENLILVCDDGTNQSSGKTMMRFDTVTLAPIDRRLIVPEMLNENEKRWLDDYHQRVYDTLAPLLEEDIKNWLKEACAPLCPAPSSGPASPKPHKP